MADLHLYGQRVNSVFQLLGEKENDITFSMAGALSKCRTCLDGFLYGLLEEIPSGEEVTIRLQQYEKNAGITDIEVEERNFFFKIEAKRGWTLTWDARHD